MRWAGLATAAGATLLSLLFGFSTPDDRATSAAETTTATVTRGELVVRTVYEGRLDSRTVVSVASHFDGPATIVSLSDEGVRVQEGDLLVRFDTSELERDLLRHETDVASREADLRKLLDAQHPMEILDLEEEIAKTRRSLAAENGYLEDSRELARDRLVSPAEIKQQEAKVSGLRDRLAGLEQRLRLTRKHLHPMELARARASLRAAREELERTRGQIEHAAIHAPGPGVVVHQALHVAGEYRTARVGDSVYANQPFLLILDFDDLLVDVAVPERELGNVRAGNPAFIQPAAWPEIRLTGLVEHVSEIAQSRPDRPPSQRYFRATIGVRDTHSRLRPGMSVVAQVVTYRDPDALLVPRRAVRFEGDTPHAVVLDAADRIERQIELGQAGETHFEVLGGLAEGERVAIR